MRSTGIEAIKNLNIETQLETFNYASEEIMLVLLEHFSLQSLPIMYNENNQKLYTFKSSRKIEISISHQQIKKLLKTSGRIWQENKSNCILQ